MIIFLTLLYCGLLAILLKLGFIKMTLWWKISPLVWMLFLLVALFIPMQWGAPAGPVNVYQTVVEIIPNVNGQVIDVPATGLALLKEGDTLFRIDPEPFQYQVDQLQAQLEDTKQNVKRLAESAEAARQTVAKTEADVGVFKSEQLAAAASVASAQAALKETQGQKKKAIASVADLKTQVAAGQREYDRIKLLVADDAAARSELDRTEIKLTGLRSELKTAEVDLLVVEDTIARFAADLRGAEIAESTLGIKLKQLVDAELPRVRALARESELAANSMIGDEHTSVARVKAQLAQAKYELGETVIKAPSDGYVVGATLRPGQRVANLPLRSWMSFIPEENITLGAGIPQYTLRHVEVGQKVEITLKLYPGRVFTGTVDKVVVVSSQGQLQPSGIVMTAPGVEQSAVPFGVRIKMDEDPNLDVSKLPGGAVGTAAIYTSKSRASHVIRRVMLRMEAWLNYVIPW